MTCPKLHSEKGAEMGCQWCQPSPGALFPACPWVTPHPQCLPVFVPNPTLPQPRQHLQVKITAWEVQRNESESSVVSGSLRPHGLCSPWNSPGQDTGVGSRSLPQGISPTLGSNPGLPHCRRILDQLSHKRNARPSNSSHKTAADSFLHLHPSPSL